MRVRIKATGETATVVGPEVNGKVLVQMDVTGLVDVLTVDEIEKA